MVVVADNTERVVFSLVKAVVATVVVVTVAVATDKWYHHMIHTFLQYRLWQALEWSHQVSLIQQR